MKASNKFKLIGIAAAAAVIGFTFAGCGGGGGGTPPPRLGTPEIAAPVEDGIVEWASIANAASYEVTVEVIYDENVEATFTEIVPAANFDLRDIAALEPGDVVSVTVRAMSANENVHMNSYPSEAVEVGIVAPLDAPTDVAIDYAGTLTWDAVANSHGYRVYADGAPAHEVADGVRTLDLTEFLNGGNGFSFASGIYDIRVRALSQDTVAVWSSALSDAVEFTVPYLEAAHNFGRFVVGVGGTVTIDVTGHVLADDATVNFAGTNVDTGELPSGVSISGSFEIEDGALEGRLTLTSDGVDLDAGSFDVELSIASLYAEVSVTVATLALTPAAGAIDRTGLDVVFNAAAGIGDLITGDHFASVGTADFGARDDYAFAFNIAGVQAGLRILPAATANIQAGDMLRAMGRISNPEASSRMELRRLNNMDPTHADVPDGGFGGAGTVTPSSPHNIPEGSFTFTWELTADDITHGLAIAPNSWDGHLRQAGFAFSIDDLIIFRPATGYQEIDYNLADDEYFQGLSGTVTGHNAQIGSSRLVIDGGSIVVTIHEYEYRNFMHVGGRTANYTGINISAAEGQTIRVTGRACATWTDPGTVTFFQGTAGASATIAAGAEFTLSARVTANVVRIAAGANLDFYIHSIIIGTDLFEDAEDPADTLDVYEVETFRPDPVDPPAMQTLMTLANFAGDVGTAITPAASDGVFRVNGATGTWEAGPSMVITGRTTGSNGPEFHLGNWAVANANIALLTGDIVTIAGYINDVVAGTAGGRQLRMQFARNNIDPEAGTTANIANSATGNQPFTVSAALGEITDGAALVTLVTESWNEGTALLGDIIINTFTVTRTIDP